MSEKIIVVRNHGRDARLLKHHFRKPHAVRVAIAPPRMDAPVGTKPTKELLSKCRKRFRAPTHLPRHFRIGYASRWINKGSGE
jgi:hypothetical protein